MCRTIMMMDSTMVKVFLFLYIVTETMFVSAVKRISPLKSKTTVDSNSGNSADETGLPQFTTHNSTDGYLLSDMIEDILLRYNNGVRPLGNSTTGTVNVVIDIAVRQIIELDEPIQVLKLNLWMRMQWQDSRLSWNENDYEGIDHIVVPSNWLWIPDITLYDSATEGILVEHGQKANIQSDGTVLYNFPVITESRCKVNVKHFPFDSQTCKLTFGSWSHDGSEIDLRAKHPRGDISHIDEHVEWHVMNFASKHNVAYYSCCTAPYMDVSFYLHLKRKPDFHLFSIIVPCIIITAIGILGFILPVEAGEKMSIGITVLLSQSVFLLVIGDKLPPSSETLPLIAVYFDFAMFLVCFACFVSVVVLNLYYKTGQVPQWARVVFLKFLVRLVFMRPITEKNTNRKYEKPKPKHEAIGLGHSSHTITNEVKMRKAIQEMWSFKIETPSLSKTTEDQQELNNNTVLNDDTVTSEKTADKEQVSEPEVTEWQLISIVLDRLGLLIYTVFFVIGTLLFFVVFQE